MFIVTMLLEIEKQSDLAAGVLKYGEGNWEEILHKCNFDSTRTPYQLSQRWALKRPEGSTKPASTKHVSIGSEERSAAIKALSLVVGPVRRSGAYQQNIQHKSTTFAPKILEVRSAATPSPASALALPVPVPAAMPLCDVAYKIVFEWLQQTKNSAKINFNWSIRHGSDFVGLEEIDMVQIMPA